jgi:hypothetical protein
VHRPCGNARLDRRPGAKHEWTSPASLIGNLCFDLRVSEIHFLNPSRAWMFRKRNLSFSADRDRGSLRTCCHAGRALLSSVSGQLRMRKPANMVGSTALRVPSFGSTSPNIRRPRPKHGHEATGPATPKLKPPGAVSKRRRQRRPGPRRPRAGGRRRTSRPPSTPSACPASTGRRQSWRPRSRLGCGSRRRASAGSPRHAP